MTTILNGLLGGFVAGLLAVGAVGLLRAAGITGRASESGASNGGRDLSRRSELLLVLGYAALAGAVLVALELIVLGVLAVPPTRYEALAVGLAWGLGLFAAVGAAVIAAAPSLRSRLADLAAFHLAYGLLLGLWIRLTWIT